MIESLEGGLSAEAECCIQSMGCSARNTMHINFRPGLTFSGTSAAAFEIMRYARVPKSFRSVSELLASVAIRWLKKMAQK